MADNVSLMGVWNVVTKATAYTAQSHDCVLANATDGAIAITLPTETKNAYVNIKKTDSSANAVTVSGVGMIDGAASLSISTQYYSYTLICDGTNWHIV